MDRLTIQKELNDLNEKLEDARKRLPAHTIRPHQLIAIEEIEDRIKELEDMLKSMKE